MRTNELGDVLGDGLIPLCAAEDVHPGSVCPGSLLEQQRLPAA
jgi:hypothetical protein